MKKVFFSMIIVVLTLSACVPNTTPTLVPPISTSIPSSPTPTPQGRTLPVTSPADSGPGTLRQAMLDARNGDTITFDPSVFPPDALVTISVISGLPQITQGNLTIDASNAGVILDGSNSSGEWQAGLEIVSSGNTIRGMQVSNFSGPGIAIAGDAEYNVIGGDRNIGIGPFGQGNLLSNNDNGIVLSTPGTSLNTITGNLIGTDTEGDEGFGNRLGVSITESAHSNVVGPDNVVAHNSEHGILISNPETVRNTLTRNSIHDNGWTDLALWDGGNTELDPPRIFDLDSKSGTLTGVACANCMVEVFSDKNNDGAIYEGKATADEMGIFNFEKGSSFVGPNLTATVTDLEGNTSQFSRPISGLPRLLDLQQGNDAPNTLLRLKESRELPDNRIGLFFGELMDSPDLNLLLNQLNTAGVKRIDTSFYEVEPPIDWNAGSEFSVPEAMDAFVDDLNEHSIQMNLLLHFWDKDGHALGEELATPRFQDQKQIDDFIEYVRFIVRHFKGRIPYYTIWTEPEYCGGGGLKCVLTEDIIEMTRQVIPVIREEDPEAKVVSTLFILTFGEEDLFALLRSAVVSQFDVISFKNVPDITPQNEYFGNEYYKYPSIIQDIKQTASSHGFTGEYWGVDLSWKSYEGSNCHSPGCLNPDHPWEALETNLQSAKHFARGIVMELGMDVVVGVEHGLDDSLWSYATIANLNIVMAGNRPIEIPVEIESDATQLTSYGFSLPNGDRLFAVWNDGIAVDFDPGILSNLTFPGMSAQKVIGIDVIHGFEQELIIEMENGNLMIRNFLIKDYPIILRLVD